MKKLFLLCALAIAAIATAQSTPTSVKLDTPPQYVLIYRHRIDTVVRHVQWNEAKAFTAIDDVTQFLERERVEPGDLVGVWRLTDTTKVELANVEMTATPVTPTKSRKWQKKP